MGSLLHSAPHLFRYERTQSASLLATVSLVGASFGGRLAAEFAVSHGSRLSKLVLVAPADLPSLEHPSPDFGRLPGATLVLVAGAGHLLLDESTQARTEIRDFLS